MHALTATLFSLLLLAPLGPGWLGVYLVSEGEQAVIAEVIPDSPAAKAGLKAGDVMLAVGDKKTSTRDQFVAAIQAHEAGARVHIHLRRGNRKQTVVVRLGERQEVAGAGTAEPAKPAKPAKPAEPAKPAWPSVGAQPATPSRPIPAVEVAPQAPAGKGYLGISVRETSGGLEVDRVLPDGPSAKSGLKSGDRLVQIGKTKVRTLADLDKALKGVRPGQRLAVGVANRRETKSLMIEVGIRPGQGRQALPDREPAVAIEVVPNEAVVAEVVEEIPAEKVVEEHVISEKPVRVRAVRERPVRERAVRAGDSRPVRVRTTRRGGRQEYNLERELSELRKELAELRKLLEELKRKGR